MPQALTLDVRDGIGVATLDTPGSPVNTVGPEVWAELDGILDRVGHESLDGLVLTSGKTNGFCAGADVGWLSQLPSDPNLDDTVALAHRVLQRMVESPVRIVAAVHGICLGGGMEIALACHARIASGSPSTSLGLPEVTLGLIPGGGGTQLLPRVVGPQVAADLLSSGRLLTVEEARSLGLVDEVVPAGRLVEEGMARARTGGTAPSRDGEATGNPDLVRTVLEGNPRGIPPGCIDALRACLEAAVGEELSAGLAVEGRCFTQLVRSTPAASRLHLFITERAAAKAARRTAAQAAPVNTMFVLGGGLMGSGIAAEVMDREVTVRVRDVHEPALERVHQYAERVLAARHAGPDAPHRRRERIHRLSTTTGWAGVETADLVLEAVYESTAVKHDVIREVESRMRPEAVLASNTSAIPIGHLASVAEVPERIVGMHFFSPVDRMALVEVIPHEGTDADVVARTIGLAVRLGKTPVVVGDSAGFFTSRVYGRWLDEGTRLVLDGARIDQIDRVAREVGFPVGPLLAQDEVAIDLVQKLAKDPVTANITATRVDLAAARALIDALVETGRRGRKAGAGWYRYTDVGKRAGPDQEIYALVGETGAAPSDDEVADRLLGAFVSESFLCLDEEVIASPADGDLASVLGIGFPRDLGGPFHYVDAAGPAVLDRIERLDAGTGDFTVAHSLRDAAAGR